MVDYFSGVMNAGGPTIGTDGYQGSGLHADQREPDYEQVIRRRFINGEAPMTAITNMMPSETIANTEFHWWDELDEDESLKLAAAGALTTQAAGVYINSSLTTLATASNAASGDSVHVQFFDDGSTQDAPANRVRPRNVVLLRNESYPSYDLRGIITSVNRSTQTVSVVLLEAPPTGSSGWNRLRVIGSASPEYGTAPEGTTTIPNKYYNYMQTFWDALRLSDEALRTRVRTGNRYLQEKAKTFTKHVRGIEKAIFFGQMSERIDPDNGQPIRTMQGIIPFLRANGGLIGNFQTDAVATWAEGAGGYTNQTFEDPDSDAGYRWLMYWFERLFRYAGDNLIGFAGTGALMGLSAMAMARGQITIESGTLPWGFRVRRLITDFGEVTFRTHPLFSHDPTDRFSFLVFPPANIKAVKFPGGETHFMKDADNNRRQGGEGKFDGICDSFQTKRSMKLYGPEEFMYLNGIGVGKVSAAA